MWEESTNTNVLNKGSFSARMERLEVNKEAIEYLVHGNSEPVLELVNRKASSMQAKRGRILSGLILIFGAAISFATIVLIFRRDIDRVLGYVPNWYTLYLVILVVARLVALSAIWNMKRWGVYVFFLFECIEVGMGLFVFTSFLTFPIRFLIGIPSLLVLLGIWTLALRSKWQAFT